MCDYPAAVRDLDFGKLATPYDVRFITGEGDYPVRAAKIKIAPGHLISVVVRTREAWALERVQIYENNLLISEKLYPKDFTAPDSLYSDIGAWLDGLYGKDRIGVREFFQRLLSSEFRGYDNAQRKIQVSREWFEEQSFFSSELFNSTGEYREMDKGIKHLHGRGQRNWKVPNTRGGFRAFYSRTQTRGDYSIPASLIAISIEEIGVFEDGFLVEWERKIYFSDGTIYHELGSFAYTWRMMSANLENGTVRLPNGKEFLVESGVSMLPWEVK